MTLFDTKKVAVCSSRIKLVTQRFHISIEYGFDDKPRPKKIPIERAARWVTCQKELGHKADGSTVLCCHTYEGAFAGVRVKHAWTDDEAEGEVDITERWTELKSLKEK